MDRPSSSTTPPLTENDDDMSSFVTKNHLFGAQKALHQEQQAMRDYFDNKFDTQKQENDARMDEIRAFMRNRRPSTSSSSRRSRSSRHSDDTFSGSSTLSSTILRRAARQDRHASRNPLQDKHSQEQVDEQVPRPQSNQVAFAQAQERQRLRRQEEERARLHQEEQDAEAQRL